jgi:hypothetical protein
MCEKIKTLEFQISNLKSEVLILTNQVNFLKYYEKKKELQ